jgi:two-component sensor histidine kinase
LLPYGASVSAVVIAALFTYVVSPLEATPTLPFTAAVILVAWRSGRGPAILAVVLSALAVDYFFLPPIGSILTTVPATVCIVHFAFVGGLICYLQERNTRIAASLRAAVATTETALREKEVLLRELQHRVKNNLQIITSLLSLQSSKLPDQASRTLFKDCQQRVRVIALVHEQLYRAPDLARIDVEAYFRELVQTLLRCYWVGSGSITPQIAVDAGALRIDQLIPCALIVNELVCNALKHAFPNGRSGHVKLEIHKGDGQVVLRVGDNGVGFALFAGPCTSGLGTQIIGALVAQLAGQLEWTNQGGTTATVTFPETNE